MAKTTVNKSGTLSTYVYLGTDVRGNKIKKLVTAKSQKELDKKVRLAKLEAEKKKTGLENMYFEDWHAKWMELKTNQLSPSTYATYKMYNDVHYKKYFHNIRLNKITELMILEYINNKSAEISKSSGKKLSSTTIRKHILHLRKVLQDALRDDNPARHIELPEEKAYRVIVPTRNEVDLIMSKYKPKGKLIIMIAAWCGLRRGEIFALRWNDINFDTRFIQIDEAISVNENRIFEYKDPKTDRGNRFVPCPDNILDKIKEYRLTLESSKDDEFMFSGRADSFSTNFIGKIKELKLNVRLHDLRHFCASWLYEQGIPDQAVAEILGHDITVLKEIYQHIGINKKKSIMDQIRNLQQKQSTNVELNVELQPEN